jgi:predicted dithiol-disulfide oxidoreductase (DUF899 family)
LASESAAPAPNQPSGRRDADVTTTPLPPVVDEPTWRRQLDELRTREKAATRDLDAFAAGETVYRTWHTNGRGCEQLSHTFPLVDLLPYGRQEEWQDVPEGWPQAPTYTHWWSSERYARYGEDP